MRVIWIGALILLAGLAGLFAYVRLAPVDPARFHAAPEIPGTGAAEVASRSGHAVAVMLEAEPGAVLARVDAIARGAPRTQVLAGSVEAGMVSYVTRTAVWGFPDVTTVRAVPAEGGGTRLEIAARQRIGQYDWGVNRARVERWLAALGDA